MRKKGGGRRGGEEDIALVKKKRERTDRWVQEERKQGEEVWHDERSRREEEEERTWEEDCKERYVWRGRRKKNTRKEENEHRRMKRKYWRREMHKPKERDDGFRLWIFCSAVTAWYLQKWNHDVGIWDYRDGLFHHWSSASFQTRNSSVRNCLCCFYSTKDSDPHHNHSFWHGVSTELQLLIISIID